VDEARHQQLTHLDAARGELLAWATANAVPLVRVEFVVPFVDTDFDAAVWLFYATDADVSRCVETGHAASVEEEFRSILADRGYPEDWLGAVAFYADSHETVQRDFAGSYLNRLR
jgi:hypothetical protein